ncbi:MAG: dTMP kinase [Bacteroidota bacterium]
MQQNHKGSFLVFEGLDGAGKSTQVNLLGEYLDRQKIPYRFMHFPRTDAPWFGELVARFLRGEFGSLETVDPYIVALLYAGDRHHAADIIRTWLKAGELVIVDRYVYSNIGFQCAKLKGNEEQDRLRNWIYSIEYEHFRIPKPQLTIFLDVPFSFTESKLTGEREGEDRCYLEGKKDIHESDLNFQGRVREIYLQQAAKEENFEIIACSDDAKNMLPPDKIFSKILDCLKKHRLIN